MNRSSESCGTITKGVILMSLESQKKRECGAEKRKKTWLKLLKSGKYELTDSSLSKYWTE